EGLFHRAGTGAGDGDLRAGNHGPGRVGDRSPDLGRVLGLRRGPGGRKQRDKGQNYKPASFHRDSCRELSCAAEPQPKLRTKPQMNTDRSSVVADENGLVIILTNGT